MMHGPINIRFNLHNSKSRQNTYTYIYVFLTSTKEGVVGKETWDAAYRMETGYET